MGRKAGNGKGKEKKWYALIGIAVLLVFFWSVSPPTPKKSRKKQSNSKVRKGGNKSKVTSVTRSGEVSQITVKEKQPNPVPIQKRSPDHSELAVRAPPLHPEEDEFPDEGDQTAADEEDESSGSPSSSAPSDGSNAEGSSDGEEEEKPKKVDVESERSLVELIEEARR